MFTAHLWLVSPCALDQSNISPCALDQSNISPCALDQSNSWMYIPPFHYEIRKQLEHNVTTARSHTLVRWWGWEGVVMRAGGGRRWGWEMVKVVIPITTRAEQTMMPKSYRSREWGKGEWVSEWVSACVRACVRACGGVSKLVSACMWLCERVRAWVWIRVGVWASIRVSIIPRNCPHMNAVTPPPPLSQPHRWCRLQLRCGDLLTTLDHQTNDTLTFDCSSISWWLV